MAIDVAQAWKALSTPMTNKQAGAFLARIDVEFGNEKDSEMLKTTELAFAGFVMAVRVEIFMATVEPAKVVYHYGKLMLERLDPIIDIDAIAFVNYHILFAAISFARDKPADEPDLLEVAIKAGEDAIGSGRLPPLKRRTTLISLVHMAELAFLRDNTNVPFLGRLLAFTKRADQEGQFSLKAPGDRYPVMTIARCYAMSTHQLASLTDDSAVMREALPYIERYIKTATKQDNAAELTQAHFCYADANMFLSKDSAENAVDLLLGAQEHYLKAADSSRSASAKPSAETMAGVLNNSYSAFRAIAAAIAQEQDDLPPLWGSAAPDYPLSSIVSLFSERLSDDEEQDQDAESLPAV